MTAYRLTFRIGRRVLSWTRYVATLATVEADARATLADAYPDGKGASRATLLSVMYEVGTAA